MKKAKIVKTDFLLKMVASIDSVQNSIAMMINSRRV